MYNITSKLFVIAAFNFICSCTTCVRCEYNNYQNKLMSLVSAEYIFMAMILLCKRQLKGTKVVEI